jgi:hypothetical protein
MQNVSKTGFLGRLLQRGASVASLLSAGRTKLFAFDELMSADALAAEKVFATQSVMAMVGGYTLLPAAASGEPGIGELSLVRENGAKVYGVVHDVSNVELLLLEALMALRGRAFVRRMVSIVDKNGYEEGAWTFVARRPEPHLRCRKATQAAILSVAAECGLPPNHLALLARLPVADSFHAVAARNGENGIDGVANFPATEPLAISCQ